MVPTELNKAIMQARIELYVLNLSNGCHIGVILIHCCLVCAIVSCMCELI
ncbi:hypothetical protein Sjap_025928 [Stephania japonica]|uniref:Uncharacterized protein n=1 Tax=Stephania japonica TaxID=461633 RepID=A0AAP0E714_9MAGN